MRLDVNSVHNIINSNTDLKDYYKWYLSHCTSLCLPYHNLTHTLGMMQHIINIYNKSNEPQSNYGFQLKEPDLYILLTSALFHDYNHSGGLYADDINVENAKNGLEQCIRNYKADDESTTELITYCKSVIDATQYPYIIDSDKLSLHQRIIRECDILVCLYDEYFPHRIIGLYHEMHPQCTLIEFLVKEMTFISDSFKNFKLVYSIDCWEAETDRFLKASQQLIKIFS